MGHQRIKHEFVEFIPQELADGVLYISIDYATAVHKCFSGCGQKVVTPLTPTDWALIYDGETASLTPSIGNWGFECQSHYWIQHDQVIWSGQWSLEQIEAGRRRDRAEKQRHYQIRTDATSVVAEEPAKRGPLGRLRSYVAWLFGRGK